MAHWLQIYDEKQCTAEEAVGVIQSSNRVFLTGNCSVPQTVLAALVPALTSRGKLQSLALGAERHYGAGGGGICRNCQRPFALPFFAPNIGFSKFARCPYCGKSGLVRLASLAALRQARHFHHQVHIRAASNNNGLCHILPQRIASALTQSTRSATLANARPVTVSAAP